MREKRIRIKKGTDSDETHKRLATLNFFWFWPGDIPVVPLHPPASVVAFVSRPNTTVILECFFPTFCIRTLWYLHLISASNGFLRKGAWESLLFPYKLDVSLFCPPAWLIVWVITGCFPSEVWSLYFLIVFLLRSQRPF